jgi:hypothetical protein
MYITRHPLFAKRTTVVGIIYLSADWIQELISIFVLGGVNMNMLLGRIPMTRPKYVYRVQCISTLKI